MDSDKLISVTTVVQNDGKIVVDFISEVVEQIKKEFQYYELLIIDNGSLDDTVSIIKQLQQEIPNIRLLVLSREYDREIAFSAALDNSIGDYVVLMDLRCDPPAVIQALLEKATSGYDVVIAEREDRSDNTFLQKIFSRLFYRIFANISGFYFAPNASYFRVFSRRAVNSITQIRSKKRYLKHFNALVGFTQGAITYKRVYRSPAEKAQEGMWTLFFRAIDIVISNSIFPLRLVTLLGVVAGFLNLLFIAYVFVVSFLKTDVAEGWISTSLVNSTMFFILFLILTVMSEYIARVLIESKDQPLYFIAEEHDSKLLTANKDKMNVV